MEANCIILLCSYYNNNNFHIISKHKINVNACSLSPEEYQEREELLKLRQSSLKKVRGVVVGVIFKFSCRKSSSCKLKWRL